MPASQMRAARVRGGGRIEVERVSLPEPGPGEVRVRVEACGLCGSDLHLFGAGFFAAGTTPGHEPAGVVDRLGAGVSGPLPGTRVAVEPMRSCGACPSCRAGRYSICRQARLAGVHDPGGLAEYLLAPAARVHPVPAALDAPLAALAEPMAVVVHGLARGGLAQGQRVLVLGAGAVGLLTVAAAHHLGASEVWVSARHPHQAERAHALGAARVLAEADSTPAALDALGREAAIDLVVETVGGTADTLRAAAAAVRPGGTVSVLGLFLGAIALDPLPLLLKELTLAWSYCYGTPAVPEAAGHASDFSTAIEVLGGARAALAPLVTHSLALDDVALAFRTAADRAGGAVKVSVIP